MGPQWVCALDPGLDHEGRVKGARSTAEGDEEGKAADQEPEEDKAAEVGEEASQVFLFMPVPSLVTVMAVI